MLGEVNIFYNFTPMSLEQAMVFTTFLGVTLGFLLYERNRLLTEIIVLAVTLFGIVNTVSYYFIPIEYKSYIHTVQFLILLSYIPISFLKRDKENEEIRPLFLS